MSSSLNFNPHTGSLAIAGELTIYQANAVAESLRSAFASGTLKCVDLAGITELDTTGLQLLLVAERLNNSSGESIALVNHSLPVLDVLALSGREVLS